MRKEPRPPACGVWGRRRTRGAGGAERWAATTAFAHPNDPDPTVPQAPSRLRRTRELGSAFLLLALGCTEAIANVEVERTVQHVILGGPNVPDALRFEETVVLHFENEDKPKSSRSIDDVELRRLFVESIDPPNADLSFTDRAEVYIQATGLPRVRVAAAHEIEPGSSVIEFVPDRVELTDYVMADDLTFTVELDGRPPEQNVLVEGHAVLDIGVTPAAACEAI